MFVRILSIIINAAIVAMTAAPVLSAIRVDGGINKEQTRVVFRYFTVQSNCLCALAALLMCVAQTAGRVPYAVWLLKYLGSVSVTVTLLTVMIYLGPIYGYKELLSGRDMFLHLICPVLAIISFLFLEKGEMRIGEAMLGLVPVILYGLLYLWKVVYCPEEKRWEDFYSFNKDGKWPVSYAFMVAGTLIICLLFYFL